MKIIKFIKQIHFIEYSIYLIIIATICIYYNVKPIATYLILCALSFAFMNTWYIEKKDKKKKEEKQNDNTNNNNNN